MMEAYFDETGTHTGPLRTRPIVMCVAGYLFTASRAQHFDEKWSSALRQAGLAYFRMSECASQKKQFEGWPAAHAERFSMKMAKLIRDHITHGVGVWLKCSEFEYLAPMGWRQYYGGEYTLCLMHCLRLIAVWVRENGYQGDIAYYFESGDKNAGEANVHMGNVANSPNDSGVIRYAAHSFVKKGTARGLEAADTLAWHINRAYNGVLRHGGVIEDYFTPMFRYLHDGRESSYYFLSLTGDRLREAFAAQPPPPPPPRGKKK